MMDSWLGIAVVVLGTNLLCASVRADEGSVNMDELVFSTLTRTEERLVSVEGSHYLVQYDVHMDGMVYVPATYPVGQNHYPATVTVFKLLLDGTRSQVGESFAGTWTEGGCFEDDPEMLVKEALKVLP